MVIIINKIKVYIASKKIFFKIHDEDTNNDNSIGSNNELIFDKGYFNANKKIICNIISGIVQEKDITSATVIDYSLIPDVIEVIGCIKKITTLNIEEDIEMNNKILDKLLKSKHIKTVNCYSAPTYMLDNLLKKNIKVNFRAEYLSDSNFITKNKLFSYSKMYYKETINIDAVMNENDLKDLKMFLEINNTLKIINIYNFSFDIVKQIVTELGNFSKRNILIIIRANSKNVTLIQEAIPHLKTLDKIYQKKHNLKFKIKYSPEYKNKNTIKQASNNILLITCVIIGIVASLSIGLIEYNNYMTKKQEEELQNISPLEPDNNNDDDYIIGTEGEDIPLEEETETPEIDNGTGQDNNNPGGSNTSKLTEDYQKLLSINSDTVGWLKVNNTYVNYPVVKTIDNDYYLNHSFYKQQNINGWIYMDYRNDPSKLDQNTIIYGHNMKSGMMFGSLNYVKNSSWYNNPDNLKITFNTVNRKMQWQIFSIYVIDVTSDYLYANFDFDSQFKAFVDKIKSRSIKDFGIEVSGTDKILTLSTCQNNSKQRLVVHAKLIN